ncbi:hypothetical protein CK203_056454 [Vitis vinifera]|uniref:Uncharacterized protein n=1 Tax=Vitis vinifera TaxID=29760 RepID=A0A438GTK0_VITVI|nr:hypothetical protein CK203_056454 [Vitis vinifera]
MALDRRYLAYNLTPVSRVAAHISRNGHPADSYLSNSNSIMCPLPLSSDINMPVTVLGCFLVGHNGVVISLNARIEKLQLRHGLMPENLLIEAWSRELMSCVRDSYIEMLYSGNLVKAEEGMFLSQPRNGDGGNSLPVTLLVREVKPKMVRIFLGLLRHLLFSGQLIHMWMPWANSLCKASSVPTFTIRTIHESHTCGGITHLGHQQASVQWVASSQAWRGKERIMATVRGSFEEGYRLLPQYCDQIRRTNPETSIYGFLNACRPLIGLDRTLLKSKYLGTLLFATGFDGDGALFSLAFGVVDEENDETGCGSCLSCTTSLKLIQRTCQGLQSWSDRQKVIVEGVEANFPTAFHGFYMRHLSDRFRKEFNNTLLVNLIWEAAQVLTVIELEAKILESEEKSPRSCLLDSTNPASLVGQQAYFEGTIKHSLDKQEKHIGRTILQQDTAAFLEEIARIPPERTRAEFRGAAGLFGQGIRLHTRSTHFERGIGNTK